MEYIICGYEFFVVACTISLFIGAYQFVVAAIRDIRHILHSINHKSQTIGNPASECMTLFFEYIRAHVAIKQLSSIQIKALMVFAKRKTTHFLFTVKNRRYSVDPKRIVQNFSPF